MTSDEMPIPSEKATASQLARQIRDLLVGLSAVIASIGVPFAAIVSTERQSEQQLARQYVELGVSVLKSPNIDQAPDLTRWAIQTVNHYGEIDLSVEAARQLRTVEVPIAVPCAADPGPRPEYPDGAEAIRGAPDIFERVKLLLAGRLMRMGREQVLEASIKGCS